MRESEFKALDPLADEVNDKCDVWFASEEFASLKAALREASAALPPTYSVSINVELRVFDTNREQELRLLETGINTSGGKAPYPGTGDSTIHRYVVDGEICELPHDFCPHCWGVWDFKLRQLICRNCGYALGKEVKLLLDSDVCPNCEEGRVSLAKLICSECGFSVDPSFVTWG